MRASDDLLAPLAGPASHRSPFDAERCWVCDVLGIGRPLRLPFGGETDEPPREAPPAP